MHESIGGKSEEGSTFVLRYRTATGAVDTADGSVSSAVCILEKAACAAGSEISAIRAVGTQSGIFMVIVGGARQQALVARSAVADVTVADVICIATINRGDLARELVGLFLLTKA